MELLICALLILIGMTVVLIRVASAAWTDHRIRKAGQPVTGEVTRLDTRRRAYYGGYLVTPVVRYRINDRPYEAQVTNRGDSAEIGSGMDLIVDPDRPYEPVATSQSTIAGALGAAVIGVLVGAGLTVWAIVLL